MPPQKRKPKTTKGIKTPAKSVPKPIPNARDGRRATKCRNELDDKEEICLPFAPFGRVVREVTFEVTNYAFLRYQASALRALREASEAYLIGLFEDAYICTRHAKRVTLTHKDIRLALRIRDQFKEAEDFWKRVGSLGTGQDYPSRPPF